MGYNCLFFALQTQHCIHNYLINILLQNVNDVNEKMEQLFCELNNYVYNFVKTNLKIKAYETFYYSLINNDITYKDYEEDNFDDGFCSVGHRPKHGPGG